MAGSGGGEGGQEGGQGQCCGEQEAERKFPSSALDGHSCQALEEEIGRGQECVQGALQPAEEIVFELLMMQLQDLEAGFFE